MHVICNEHVGHEPRSSPKERTGDKKLKCVPKYPNILAKIFLYHKYRVSVNKQKFWQYG